MSFNLDSRFPGAKGADCLFPELKFRCCWLHESTSMTPTRALEDLKQKEQCIILRSPVEPESQKFPDSLPISSDVECIPEKRGSHLINV